MAITIDDFSKIWASTSPLTPYSFSESNYKEGWNFVGSTPPSRQMWDFLQKNNDEKAKFLLDNFADYLPLSGGEMTGAIVGNPLTLTADDGNDSVDLVLNSSGSATWNGKEVERVNESGTTPHGYIRYESGIQVCFGKTELSTNQTSYVTYPVPFISVPSVGVCIDRTVSVRVFGSSQATGFSISCSDTVNDNNVKWVSVGWWK